MSTMPFITIPASSIRINMFSIAYIADAEPENAGDVSIRICYHSGEEQILDGSVADRIKNFWDSVAEDLSPPSPDEGSSDDDEEDRTFDLGTESAEGEAADENADES